MNRNSTQRRLRISIPQGSHCDCTLRLYAPTGLHCARCHRHYYYCACCCYHDQCLLFRQHRKEAVLDRRQGPIRLSFPPYQYHDAP